MGQDPLHAGQGDTNMVEAAKQSAPKKNDKGSNPSNENIGNNAPSNLNVPTGKQFRALARLVAHKFTLNVNSEKQNRQVSLRFQIEGGPYDSQMFTYGPKSLTDKTKPIVRAAYRAMGWNGQGNPAKMDAQRFHTQVEVTVIEQKWTDAKGDERVGMKVEFVDPLIRTTSPELVPNQIEELNEFFASDSSGESDYDQSMEDERSSS